MNVFDAIAARQSYRGEFEHAPIPRQTLVRILEAGYQAPVWQNRQTTEILALERETLKNAVYSAFPIPATWTAPVILVFVSNDADEEGARCATENYCAVMENILLAMTECGYAGVWLGVMPEQLPEFQRLSALLGLPPEKRIRAVLPLGIPVYEQTARRTPELDKVVTFL